MSFVNPLTGEKITLLRATGEKLEPTQEQLARRIDIPEGGLAILDVIKKPVESITTSLSMPQNIAGIGIGIGGLIIGGIILFLLLRK